MELRVIGEDPVERADARRNRLAVLCAAERLFAEHGVANVSMDAVAAAAGVGKGTLFRRFGDRAGLARALLQESERRLQENFLHGPPPLGPGAPPQARLKAFGSALLDQLERHADLIAAAEFGAGGRRFTAGPYGVHRLHVSLLVRRGRPGGRRRVPRRRAARAPDGRELRPLAPDPRHAARAHAGGLRPPGRPAPVLRRRGLSVHPQPRGARRARARRPRRRRDARRGAPRARARDDHGRRRRHRRGGLRPPRRALGAARDVRVPGLPLPVGGRRGGARHPRRPRPAAGRAAEGRRHGRARRLLRRRLRDDGGRDARSRRRAAARGGRRGAAPRARGRPGRARRCARSAPRWSGWSRRAASPSCAT